MQKEKYRRRQKVRKKQKSPFSMWQLVLYYTWYGGNASLFFIFPFAAYWLHEWGLRKIEVVPAEAFFCEPVQFWLMIGCALLGAGIGIAFCLLTDRGFLHEINVQKGDGSWTDLFGRKNGMKFFSLLIVAGLLLLICGFYNYRYFTPHEFVIRNAFSVHAKQYRYADVMYLEQCHWTETGRFSVESENFSFYAVMPDGTRLEIVGRGADDWRSEQVKEAFEQHKIPIWITEKE